MQRPSLTGGARTLSMIHTRTYMYIYILIPLFGHIYIHTPPATIVPDEGKEGDKWSACEEVGIPVLDDFSPTRPPSSPVSIPSPNYSPSPMTSPPLSPVHHAPPQAEPPIDLTADDEWVVDPTIMDPTFNNGPIDVAPPVVLPLGFDPEPEFVMRDDEARGEFWCDHCSLHFTFRSVLHDHLRTTRHDEMLDFLNGEPRYFCVVCKTLPEMPHHHESTKSHRRKVCRLGRGPRDADVALRQVVMGPDHRRVAILLPEGE